MCMSLERAHKMENIWMGQMKGEQPSPVFAPRFICLPPSHLSASLSSSVSPKARVSPYPGV